MRRLSFRASASHGESHYQSAPLPVRVPAAPLSVETETETNELLEFKLSGCAQIDYGECFVF